MCSRFQEIDKIQNIHKKITYIDNPITANIVVIVSKVVTKGIGYLNLRKTSCQTNLDWDTEGVTEEGHSSAHIYIQSSV